MSEVSIPNEAWQAIYDQNVWDIASALEIAAPFIARAAQVQVLREMAEGLHDAEAEVRGVDAALAGAFRVAAYRLEQRAYEIEEGRR